LDYFHFYGIILNSKFMQRDPTTVKDLKDRIVRACRTISPDLVPST